MKKEVIIAIILGVCVGLIITLGVHRAQQSLRARDLELSPSSPQTSSQQNNLTSPHSLVLYDPQDSVIYDTDEIQISGITSEHSLIAVIRDTQHSTTFADEQGSFATTINLKPGANRVIINSHSLEGTLASASADVVYSTADLDDVPSTVDQEDEE